VTIKQKYIFKKHFVNFFGGLGYLVCCILWLTSVIVYTGFIKDVLLPLVSKPVPVSEVPVPAAPVIDLASNTPLMIIAIIITFAVTVLALYIFIRIPKTLIRTSKQIVHETADTAAPVVMRIQHIQQPEHHPVKLKKMAGLIVAIVKIVLVVVPLVLILCSGLAHQTSLDIGLASMIAVWLAGLCAALFGMQYIIAALVSVKRQDIL
jgi:hypothetical protein